MSEKKPYYHQHEKAYQDLKANGYVGWGKAKSLNELGDKKTNEYLQATAIKYFPQVQEKTALDVGCGTGTTAFHLARLGFNVTGVDLSATAIEMGRGLAEEQNLNIEFVVGDVLGLEDLGKKFDLIYDSHCLHCIVFDEDRRKVLTGARKALAKGGVFIIDTMVMPEKNFDAKAAFGDLRLDDEFILWHKTKPAQEKGVAEFAGEFWCVQRRIYPADVVVKEAISAGFEIAEQVIDVQPGTVSMLRLVLR